MDEKKYVKYDGGKKPTQYGGYVEVDDLDVDYKSIGEVILEAKRVSVKENIKANSIILNEHYVKTPHLFVGDGFLPPMICGLEIYMTADELPDEYAFSLLEKTQTERERLCGKVRNETAQDVLEQFICEIVNARLCSTNDDLYYELLELKDDLLKKNYGKTTE